MPDPVTVQTREEFEKALKTADEIVVEGDVELRAYAENFVTPRPPWEAMLQRETTQKFASPLQGRPLRLPPGRVAPGMNAFSAPRKSSRNSAVSIAITGIVVAGIVGFFALGENLSSVFATIGESLPNSQLSYPGPTNPPIARVDPLDFLVRSGWIIVALVGIVLTFLLVKQAISQDRNVELSWKVTAKVSGKLIIKKVPVAATVTPRPKAKKAG